MAPTANLQIYILGNRYIYEAYRTCFFKCFLINVSACSPTFKGSRINAAITEVGILESNLVILYLYLRPISYSLIMKKPHLSNSVLTHLRIFDWNLKMDKKDNIAVFTNYCTFGQFSNTVHMSTLYKEIKYS